MEQIQGGQQGTNSNCIEPADFKMVVLRAIVYLDFFKNSIFNEFAFLVGQEGTKIKTKPSPIAFAVHSWIL